MSSARTTLCFSLLLAGMLMIGSGTILGQELWNDVLPQVKQRCAEKWQSDYEMQAYCIKKQHEGWDNVHRDSAPAAPPHLSPQAMPRTTQSEEPFVPPGPADVRVEDGLIAIVGKYTRLFNDVPNDMVKGGLRPERGHEICNFTTVLYVKNWRGKVHSLSSNNEGRGVLEIDLGGDVYVRTMNNSFSDIGYETLIPHGSLLFDDTASLHVGQFIEFSGSLFRDNLDCFKETSLTVDGAMRQPEFLIRFSSVRHKDSDTAGRDAVVTASVPAAPATSPLITATPPAAINASEPSNAPLQSPAFLDGKNARTGYETWFSSIAIAEYRAGATFWASNRSGKAPPICHYSSPDFENGCLEAKRILTPIDARRRTEPDFKQGWNNF